MKRIENEPIFKALKKLIRLIKDSDSMNIVVNWRDQFFEFDDFQITIDSIRKSS